MLVEKCVEETGFRWDYIKPKNNGDKGEKSFCAYYMVSEVRLSCIRVRQAILRLKIAVK